MEEINKISAKELAELAKEYLSFLQTKQRINGETFICSADGLSDENENRIVNLAIAVHAADDMLPEDFKYKHIQKALVTIIETCAEQDEDSLNIFDLRSDMLDQAVELADVYNADLLDWLSSHFARSGRVDELIRDGAQADGLFALIMQAQATEIEEIFGTVLDYLIAEIEDR